VVWALKMSPKGVLVHTEDLPPPQQPHMRGLTQGCVYVCACAT